MRKLCCSFIFFIISFISFSQATALKAPRIQWQRCLGGSAKDAVSDAPSTTAIEERPLSATSDGGYIFGGTVSSNDGDIIGNHGSFDIWLTRINQYGSTLWKKCFGGSLKEQVSSIQQTADGGFIIVGSTSSNDGDVSGNHGGLDVWVLRLDGLGTILWQKCLGGSNADKANQVRVTSDNGYIITGYTQSKNGDVSGNHPGTDSTDVWIVKLNSSGSIIWQKCLGGSAPDVGVSVDITNDGGFILANTTLSNNGDISGSHGASDIWVVKLNEGGSVLWQKCLGGSLSEQAAAIRQVSDGGFIVVGRASSLNGDVIDHIGQGIFDEQNAWIVRLDSIGNIIWSKCYGSPFGGQRFNDVIELPNGDFVACGHTDNLAGGNLQSLNDRQNNAWLIQITSIGSIVWQNTFGASGYDPGAALVRAPDGGFLMLGMTSGNYDFYENTYDVIGSHGPAADLWVVKFGLVNTVKGTVYFDRNLNGTKEADEPFVTGGLVKSMKGDASNSSIPTNGIFINTVDTGSYSTTIDFSPYFISVPASKVSNFTTYNNKDSFSFAMQPIPGKRDLTVSVVPLGVPRPGFNLSCRVYYKNSGTDTIANGEIVFKKDYRLGFLSAFPAQSSITGDTIKWSYSNLKPLDTASILVHLRVAQLPTANINDTLSSLAIITPVDGDLTPADDTAYLNQRVVGSYDPNDKSENLAGRISLREVSSNSYINYLVRFQNTGTDTAFNVTVRDTLDNKLDWSTLQMIAASHSYQLNIKSQNQLTWSFNNIKLVDSNRNEPASHGFIAYRVKPKNNLAIGDVIKNTASIYFDFNHPVETNTQETEVVMHSINNPQVGVPIIISFTPTSAASGATVTITGTNLTGATAVSFGGTTASSFTVNSATSITATLGAGASGDVSVTTAGGTTNLAGFTFIAAPTITSFTPTSAASGATVTITGTNLTGATSVSFGGTAANSFTVNSGTSITATVGNGASGNISVTTPGGTATLAGFTFIAAPTITSFTPVSGGTGASITIAGTDFTGATAVSFGGTAASSFTVNSLTSITATVGSGASGNVSVTTAGGTATLAGFTFIAAPTVTSFTPASATSGTTVTITGTNLTGATAVSFGGTSASSFTVNSTTSITATVGTGASGSISVTTPGGTATLPGFTFTVIASSDGAIRLYPNPTNGSFVIDSLKLSDNWERLEIFDADGRRKLLSFDIKNKTTATIHIEHLANGFYTAILRRKNGQPETIKFLKL